MGGMDSCGRLTGKAAIITGGEGSIGMATARAFAAEGARVCLVGLVEDELRGGACELGDAAIWAVADVTSSVQVKTAVARAAETFGRLDVVVSNAGISGVIAPVADYPEDVFDQVLVSGGTTGFGGVQRADEFARGAGCLGRRAVGAPPAGYLIRNRGRHHARATAHAPSRRLPLRGRCPIRGEPRPQ
jgi:NAD(P)-dependent dehydrogenase (short-subunit alcohol dehydrogenase family)